MEQHSYVKVTVVAVVCSGQVQECPIELCENSCKVGTVIQLLTCVAVFVACWSSRRVTDRKCTL